MYHRFFFHHDIAGLRFDIDVGLIEGGGNHRRVALINLDIGGCHIPGADLAGLAANAGFDFSRITDFHLAIRGGGDGSAVAGHFAALG